MIKTVKKQGGSLKLTIPKEYADALALEENSPVDLSCADGKITIKNAPDISPIKGFAEAAEEYNDANAGGMFSPRYGRLMFDVSDGDLWVDEFYSVGHNEFKVYHSSDVINLGEIILSEGESVTAANVKKYAEKFLNRK